MADKTPDTFTPTEAARLLGVSPRRIRQLAEEGRLAAIQATPLRVSAVDVLAMRENRKGTPTSTPKTSKGSLLTGELLEALAQARREGAAEARMALEAVESEVRARAERAEQRAAEAETALRVAESTKAALEARLEALESRSWRNRWKR